MQPNLGEHFEAIEVKAHGQETSSTTGSKVALTVSPQRALALVDISAVGADADETMALAIEGTNDGGTTWEDAEESGESLGTATQPTGAQLGLVGLKPFLEYRYKSTMGGTTPDFTYGIHVLAWASKAPAIAETARDLA